MGFLDLFKRETIEQKMDRYADEMKNRVASKLNGKNPDYQKIYQEEMRKLDKLQNDIITPPWYSKKTDYRTENIKILKRLVTEYETFFAKNVDDKLCEAGMFGKTLSDDFRTVEDRERYLDGLRATRNTRKGHPMHEKNNQRVGDENNRPAFELGQTITSKISEKQNNNADILAFIEDDIHKTIGQAMDDFDPEKILGNQENVENREIDVNVDENEVVIENENINEEAGVQDNEHSAYKKMIKLCIDLQVLVQKKDGYDNDDQAKIKGLVTELKLDSENNPLKDILQKNVGLPSSGLNFMIECYPNILVDTILNKVLTELNSTALSFIKDGRNLRLLNPKGYVLLCERRKALSCVMGEIGLSKTRILNEYKDKTTIKEMEEESYADIIREFEKLRPLMKVENDDQKKLLQEHYELLLKIMNYDTIMERTKDVKKMVHELKLVENTNEDLKNIVQANTIFAGSGLQFMIDRHPNLLVEFTLLKFLKEMEKVGIINEDVHSLHKKISLVTNKLAQSMGYIKKEYIMYQDGAPGEKIEEDQIEGEENQKDENKKEKEKKEENKKDENNVISIINDKKENNDLIRAFNEMVKSVNMDKTCEYVDLFKKRPDKKLFEEVVRCTEKSISEQLKNGKTLDEIYEAEMEKLGKIQMCIVSYYKQKLMVRDEDIIVLRACIEEYENCFVLNIDDRLREAKLFLENVDTDERKKMVFLQEVRDNGIGAVLSKKNENPVGSERNPGLFQLYERFYNKVITNTAGVQRVPLEYFEKDIHEDLVKIGNSFNWQCLNDHDYFSGDEKKFRDLLTCVYYGRNEDIIQKLKNVLRDVVEKLNLAEDEKCPISEILRAQEDVENTGMKFMIECYPAILTDMAFDKLLGNMDEANRQKIVEAKDLTLLKHKYVTGVAASKKVFSCIAQGGKRIQEQLQQEYKEYLKKRKNQQENLQNKEQKE